MLEEVGFTEIRIGDPVDTFGGAEGEPQARAFQVYGYAFRARKPTGLPVPEARAEVRR
jgi:hypothetical protein